MKKSRFPYFKEYRLDIIKDGYPVQQDNLDTSLSNVRAAALVLLPLSNREQGFREDLLLLNTANFAVSRSHSLVWVSYFKN